MADEEVRNSTEKKDIDFNDSNEPIESIEKTVEDLKKKIQELADIEDKEEAAAALEENEEDDFEIPSFVSGEQKDSKIDEIKNETVKTVNESIRQLRTGAEKVMASDEMQKTLAYIKENAVKAVDTAKVTINEIAENPTVRETSQKAMDTLKIASDKAKEAGDVIVEAVKPVVQNVDEFMKKPEVQETIVKVRTTTAETYEKVSEKVKDLLNKE